MGGLLNTASQLMCPHGGTVSAVTSNDKTRVGGSLAVRASDTFTIAGCPLNIAGSPHPCVLVQWVQPATQSRATGDFTLTQDSVGLCVAGDQAVQGTVLINFTQPQVSGR